MKKLSSRVSGGLVAAAVVGGAVMVGCTNSAVKTGGATAEGGTSKAEVRKDGVAEDFGEVHHHLGGGVEGAGLEGVVKSVHTEVPNGEYVVKLYFAEEEVVGGRGCTYVVKDGDAVGGKTVKEVRDFSGGKGYVDTVPVRVTAGEISITFAAEVERGRINAIEIVPR